MIANCIWIKYAMTFCPVDGPLELLYFENYVAINAKDKLILFL